MNPNSHSGAPGGETKPYLTSNEVASRLMVAPNTVRLWAEKGLLRAQTTAGGHRRFPREEVDRFVRERNAHGDGGMQRILVVDDDRTFARYLKALIAGAGGETTEVLVAHDGFGAGHLVHMFRPNVVLLDLMMPGLDGFHVCHLIKHEPATRAIRVIAMTGYPSEEHAQRIIGNGAETCLSKPLDDDRLLTLLGLGSGETNPPAA